MTSTQQRALLQRQIWQIANRVRGAVDGWDFKQYVLGTLFYRFISENFANYIEGGDDSIKYAELPDSVITYDICRAPAGALQISRVYLQTLIPLAIVWEIQLKIKILA